MELSPNKLLSVDGLLRAASLVAQCSADHEPEWISSAIITTSITAIIGDQRQARLGGITMLFDAGVLDEVDKREAEFSAFEGFHVLSTAGHLEKQGWMKQGAGLMVKVLSGSMLWMLQDAMMLTHAGDEM